MLCRGRTVSLFTLNGDPILDQDVCHETEDTITACAFYEGSGNEYLERDLIFTGHRRGVVNVSYTDYANSVQLTSIIMTDLESDNTGRQIRARTCEAFGSS